MALLQETRLYRQIPPSWIYQYLEIYNSIDFSELDSQFKNENLAINQKLDMLTTAIQSAIFRDDGEIDSSFIFYFSKLLETGLHLKQVPENACLVFAEIRDLTTQAKLKTCLDFSHSDEWREAILRASKASEYSRVSKDYNKFSREKSHADSLLYWKRKGYSYELDISGYRLREASAKKAAIAINKKIALSGGLHSANMTMDLMNRSNLTHDGSFLFGRKSGTRNTFRSPNTPWNYLYGLCMKNFDVVPRRKNKKVVLDKMRQMAVSFAASYNTESYSSYEYMNFEPESWLSKIYEILLYDELFSIPQWQPRSLSFLFAKFSEELDNLKYEYGPKSRKTQAIIDLPFGGKEQWNKIAQTILSAPETSLAIIPKHQRGSETKSYLQCAIKAEKLNNSFIFPWDTAQRNEYSDPFILTSKQDLFVQPRAISGRAFAKKTFSVLRQKITETSGDERCFDNLLGGVLERVTKSLFKKYGYLPSVENGEYGSKKNIEGEVDFIYETAETVFLIECKKKPLSNTARRGDILGYLADFDDSFLKSVEQLSRLEAKLRSNETLGFLDGKRISLQGREVEKIIVNLFDHGSLQSRMITIPMIKVLCSSKLNASDISDKKVAVLLQSINKRIKRMVGSLEKMHLSDEDKSRNILHNFSMSTFWLSIDQLYYVLEKGGNLRSGLNLFRGVTYQSGDLMSEIQSIQNLHGPAKEMQEWATKNNKLFMR